MARKPKREPIVHLVSGEGSDDDIRARAAEKIGDWAELAADTQDRMVALIREHHKRPGSARFKLENTDGVGTLSPAADKNATLNYLQLCASLGTNSADFSGERLLEIGNYFGSIPGDTSDQVNSALAFVAGAGCKDTVQSALATQMAITHNAALRALNRALTAGFVEQAQVFGNLSTKLLNAYTRQAEVLSKLQRGGEQVIKHVHIDNRGGQAVVTDQVVTRGGNEKTGDQPHAGVTALLGSDPFGSGVPIPCHQGQEALPDARWPVSGRA